MKTVSKRHNFIKKVVVCLLTAVLLYVLLSIIGSVLVFRLMFRRTELSALTELSYADIDADRYARSAFTFDSGGRTLSGYLYEKPDPTGTVVVAGGLYSGADRHLSEIICFLDHNWQVFAFDATGVGKSEGDSIVGLPQTKRDLLAAIRALRADRLPADQPLVLYGHSVGGYASVAVLAQTDEVDAAVSLAGFNSPVETMYYHARQRLGFLADAEYPFMWLHNRLTFGEDAAIAASDVLGATEVPVAVIEGTGDTTVPPAIGIGRYAASCGNPKVEYVQVDAPYKNAHSALWLTEAAARKTAERLASAPETALSTETRLALNEVDPEFMAYVLDFYERAIEP